MRRLLMFSTLTLTQFAQAAVLAVAVEGAVRLELHDTTGPCLGEARHAVYTDGRQRVPGCWVARDGEVHVAFLDGDALQVPVRAFRRPEEAMLR
jgi:hypothetical protein